MDEYYREEDCVVPLKEPIKISALQNEDNGQIFTIKEDNQFDPDEHITSNTFFEPNDLLKNCYIPDDDEGEILEDDKSPFERMCSKMEDISGEGLVYKKVLSPGSGNIVPPQSIIQIHWNGYLEYADEPFDSSRLRDMPLKRKLGNGELLVGLDMGINTMRKGELARFIIQPKYAFGKMGCPPRIPPDCPVMYEVELLNIIENAGLEDYNYLSETEKKNIDFSQVKEMFTSARQKGKILFDDKKFGKSYQQYRRAATILEDYSLKNEEEEREQQQMLLKMYHHMAVCSNKLAKSGRCINYCNKILAMEPNNLSAFYFKGKSLHQQQEFDEARHYLLKASRLAPNNLSVAEELRKLDENINRFQMMEKNMYSKMFSRPVEQSKEEKERESRMHARKEEQCMYCPEDFVQYIKEEMEKFSKDKSRFEWPFPGINLSIGQIQCIITTAEDLGLKVQEFGSGQDYKIKIVKESHVVPHQSDG